MSDTGRQSLTDKATAALKVRVPTLCTRQDRPLTRRSQPDSEKSTTEHFGDKLSGKTDSAASTFQPQSEKSSSQKMGDAFSSNSNENQVRSFARPIPASSHAHDVLV